MPYTDKQMKDATQIAYLDFGGAYKELQGDQTEMIPPASFTIDELWEKYLDLCDEGPDQQTQDIYNSLSDAQKQWSLMICDRNQKTGFYACVIRTDPNSKDAIVAFRGSEDISQGNNFEKDWWEADIKLIDSIQTTQHAECEKFMKDWQSYLNGLNISVTGHSLGGNLAEYFMIVSGKFGLRDNISSCISFDGPGFSNEFIEKYRAEIASMSSKMRHIRWSFIGSLLNDLPGVSYIGAKIDTGNVKAREDCEGFPDFLKVHDTTNLKFSVYGGIVEDTDGTQIARVTGWDAGAAIVELSKSLDAVSVAAALTLTAIVAFVAPGVVAVVLGTAVKAALVAAGIAVASAVAKALADAYNAIYGQKGVRDFRVETKQHFLDLAKKANNNGGLWDGFTDLFWGAEELLPTHIATDAISKLAGGDRYNQRRVDLHDTSVAQMEEIFTKVYNIDIDYSGKISASNEALRSKVKAIKKIEESIVPSHKATP
jgi:hypothetical protein